MGKLIIEGNKVYSVDEACMKRKNLSLEQIRQMEAAHNRLKEQEREQEKEQDEAQASAMPFPVR